MEYQFVQQQQGIAYLNIVPSEQFSRSDWAFILEELKRIFILSKDAIEIKLLFTDHLERTLSTCVRFYNHIKEDRRY